MKLRNIYNTSRICLIPQGNPVCSVIAHAIVDNRLTLIILCMSEFCEIDISRLTVLIGGVIGDVNPVLMSYRFIPPIQEFNTLFLFDSVNKRRYFGITINLHIFRKERMIVSVIRIVLTCIILCNNRIGR